MAAERVAILQEQMETAVQMKQIKNRTICSYSFLCEEM